jgi:hypothetical protein
MGALAGARGDSRQRAAGWAASGLAAGSFDAKLAEALGQAGAGGKPRVEAGANALRRASRVEPLPTES